MHDLAAADEIAETALRVAAENGGGRVRRVHILLGPRSHLDPLTLREAFEVVAFDSAADGAELEIKKPPATCRCNTCGRIFDSPTWPALCVCGSADVFSDDSSEIAITAIDVEGADPPPDGDTTPG